MPITCREIMDPSPSALAPEDTVARALDLLLERRQLAVPVVDASGKYLGCLPRAGYSG